MVEELNDFPVVIELPVLWGQMDAFGHLNNTAYFRYFESARIAYFEKIGYLAAMEDEGVGPILASTRCRFRRAVQFPDTVRVGARVTEMGEDRFLMEYRIVSQAHRAAAAEGDGLIVNLNYRTNEKEPLPDRIKKGIEELEKRTF